MIVSQFPFEKSSNSYKQTPNQIHQNSFRPPMDFADNTSCQKKTIRSSDADQLKKISILRRVSDKLRC